MSSANLKKFLNDVAAPHFKKRAGDKGLRKQTIYEQGQIFVVDQDEYLTEFYKIGKFLGIEKGELKKKEKAAVSLLQAFAGPKARADLTEERLQELQALLKDKTFLSKIKTKGKRHLFIIKDYSRIGEWKKKRNPNFGAPLVAIYEELGADKKLAGIAVGGNAGTQKKHGVASGIEDMKGFQLGHGDQGTAVSGLTARELKEKTQKEGSLTSKDKDKIYNVFAEVNDELKIDIHHEFVFEDNGKFRKDYVLILSLQSAAINQKDAKRESDALKKLKGDLVALAQDKNSTRLRDAIRLSLMHSMAKGKYLSTSAKTKAKFNERSNAKIKKKIKRKTNTRIVSLASITTRDQVKKLKGNKRQHTRKKAGTERSLLTYINEINKRLPRKVEENMGAPALESRTGRFAQSARAVNVTKTKQGHPSIGYTYAKNPYQVFEPGEGKKPWASTDRDPRQVIDRSLREIAVELALGRFYTRRL